MERTPTIVMLREITILDPGEPRNQRKILLDMAKIGDGAPSTIWKENLMVCTGIIHPASMMNGIRKTIVRDKPTRRAGPVVQGIMKIQP